MYAISFLLSTWAVLSVLQESLCYDFQRYCAKRCMMGRGGILCHCNAMHFTGKRDGSQDGNVRVDASDTKPESSKTFLDFLLDDHIDRLLADIATERLAGIARDKNNHISVLQKAFSKNKGLKNGDNSNNIHSSISMGQGNTAPYSHPESEPSVSEFQRALEMNWMRDNVKASGVKKSDQFQANESNKGTGNAKGEKEEEAEDFLEADELPAGNNGGNGKTGRAGNVWEDGEEEVPNEVSNMINKVLHKLEEYGRRIPLTSPGFVRKDDVIGRNTQLGLQTGGSSGHVRSGNFRPYYRRRRANRGEVLSYPLGADTPPSSRHFLHSQSGHREPALDFVPMTSQVQPRQPLTKAAF